MDKETMKQAIMNRWRNENNIGASSIEKMADLALDALETIGVFKGTPCRYPVTPCTCTNGIGCVNVPLDQW